MALCILLPLYFKTNKGDKRSAFDFKYPISILYLFDWSYQYEVQGDIKVGDGGHSKAGKKNISILDIGKNKNWQNQQFVSLLKKVLVGPATLKCLEVHEEVEFYRNLSLMKNPPH